MPTLVWILGFTLLGSVLSVAAAATYLLLPDATRQKSIGYLISFAIGMLLGAAFLHLLPEALEHDVDVHALTGTALAAIIVFFLLEKALIWRHHHHGDHDREPHRDAAAGSLILFGDSFHNFLDGVLITAAFVADFHLGVVTALAVIAHEVPQELGDFAVLLYSGYSRSRALLFNMLTSLAMIVGALLAWYALAAVEALVPYLLAFTAASFVYIAVSDLMPIIHREMGLARTAVQLALILVGLGLNVSLHAH